MLALLLIPYLYHHHCCRLRNKSSLPMYKEQRPEEVPNVIKKCLLKPMSGLPGSALFLFLREWLNQLSPGMRNACELRWFKSIGFWTSC